MTKAQFRHARALELEEMAVLLTENGFIIDDGPLRGAAGRCRANQISSQDLEEYNISDLWGYRIDDLNFVSLGNEALRKSCPRDVKDVRLTLSIDLVGTFSDVTDSDDPFVRLVVDADIRGLVEYNNDYRHISSSWHLDRHQMNATSNEPEFVHPHYHFQYGGHRAQALSDFGEQMLLEAPRLAHPPLDGILAVDFILSNYFGKKWRNIRTDEIEYERLVTLAQMRCWRAYAAAIASAWPFHNINSSWEGHLLWPQILPGAFITKF